MVNEVRVDIVGLREFRRDLRRAGKAFPKELAKANQQAGQIVADEAIRRAPSGAHQGGGTVVPIRRSIKSLRRAGSAAVAIGGARTPQGLPTEFGGTLARHASAYRTTVRQRAYLYPAIAAKTDQVLLVYSRLIDQVAGQAFGD